MKKTYNKWFLNDIRRAISDYEMIKPSDKIALGLSGGKDSIFLLYTLSYLLKYAQFPYELHGIHIDLGLGIDIKPLAAFCEQHNISFHSEKTEIYDIVFHHKKAKNPCSLCAKLRRGALNTVAQKMGCNKVALGHHADDVIETLLLNVLYVGKMGTFHPYIHFTEKNLSIMRPLVYVKEKTITTVINKEHLPVITNPCPLDQHTKREEMKDLIKCLEKKFPDVHPKMLTALQNIDYNNIWKQRND